MAEASGTDPILNPNGLSDDQCKELYSIFMRGGMAFGVVSLVAHLLVWAWQPWFPGGG